MLMLWKSSEKHKWYRYLTLFSFTSECVYGRTECLFSHSFFLVKTSFHLGSCFRTGKPLLFSCLSPINHRFFKNPASFSLSIDTWIVSSPSCPAVCWQITAGASFRFLIFGTQLKMTWEGLTFKGQALNLAWNSSCMCWVADLWLSSWLVAEVARGSPRD